MHPQTLIHNSSTNNSMDEQHQQSLDQDLDDHISNNNKSNADLDLDHNEPDSLYCIDNNVPPESYSVCQSKVADWLDRNNTFIERTPSVKLGSSCQTPPSRRSISITQRPKLSIIGFRKKPGHQMDGKTKTKNNDKMDNVRLFRNRSEPGRDYCLLITEPVSPKVSCAGRVGSVRVVQGRKGSVWRTFKAAFSNLVHTNRVAKIAG